MKVLILVIVDNVGILLVENIGYTNGGARS